MLHSIHNQMILKERMTVKIPLMLINKNKNMIEVFSKDMLKRKSVILILGQICQSLHLIKDSIRVLKIINLSVTQRCADRRYY